MIWDDEDVQWVAITEDGRPNLLLGDLSERDRDIVLRFIGFDEEAGNTAPANAFVDACSSGVAAFEHISSFDPYGKLENPYWRGWRKFLLWAVGLNIGLMWQQHRDAQTSGAFAAWAVDAFDRFQWTDVANDTLRGLCDELRQVATAAGVESSAIPAAAQRAVAFSAERFPCPPIEFDPVEYNHLELALSEINSLKTALETVGVVGQPVDLAPYGASLALPFDDGLFTVVSKSANGQRPGMITVAAGVLKHMRGTKDAALQACNEHNLLGKGAACVFDAATGSVILRTAFPLAVLTAIPEYLRVFSIELAADAYHTQARLAEWRLRGTPFAYNQLDVQLIAKISCD